MLGMGELVQVETAKQYRHRVAVLCVNMLFARTQVPCVVGDVVRGIAERYGTEAAIVASHAVLETLEAGRQQGMYEEEIRRRK